MKKQIFIIIIQIIFIIHINGQNVNQNIIKINKTDKNPESCFYKSLPGPAGTIVGLDNFCQAIMTITYKVPPISGATSYIWTLPTGFNGNSNSDSIVVNVTLNAVSGNITVKGHNSSGDGVASSLFVTVNMTPLVSFYTSIVNGCQPLNVWFLDNSYPSGSNCLWNFGDGQTSIDIYPTHIYNLPGNYSVQLTSTTPQGCTASVNIPNIITVYPQPNANYTWNPSIASPNTAVVFTNHSTLANNYHWDFGDGNTSTLENPTHTYNYIGNYDVWLYSYTSFGCADSVYHQIKILQTGLTEINTNKVNFVLDNSSKILYINNLVNKSVISIFDISGKLILLKSISENIETININQFAKGIYIIKVNNEKESLVSKFINE
jgi:PKD repeat protein